MGKKSSRPDNLDRSFSLTVEGISFDSIVERARLVGAKVFEVPADQIHIRAAGLRPAQMTPFIGDLSHAARPETWYLNVVVSVRDKAENG